MRLFNDGIWTANKIHLKILKTAEECSKTKSNIYWEHLKRKSNVGGTFMEHVKDLIRMKFISYSLDYYKITISGYDCLAINHLRTKGLEAFGDKIGIGKESDIYFGIYNGQDVVLKFHRLGRTSFRTVKKNRNYTKEDLDWTELNRISCKREVEYLEMFKDMSVPKVLDYNRHVIVEELLLYEPLYKIKIDNYIETYDLSMNFIKDLWKRGYVHGDFNEFNIMVNDEDIKVLDFPQCIKNTEEEALIYLKRDFECIKTYFIRKYKYEPEGSTFFNFVKDLGIEKLPVEVME